MNLSSFQLPWFFVAARGGYSGGAAEASHCGGLSCYRVWASECADVSSCGTWALQRTFSGCDELSCMWNLPRPGIKSGSPGQAGRQILNHWSTRRAQGGCL